MPRTAGSLAIQSSSRCSCSRREDSIASSLPSVTFQRAISKGMSQTVPFPVGVAPRSTTWIHESSHEEDHPTFHVPQDEQERMVHAERDWRRRSRLSTLSHLVDRDRRCLGTLLGDSEHCMMACQVDVDPSISAETWEFCTPFHECSPHSQATEQGNQVDLARHLEARHGHVNFPIREPVNPGRQPSRREFSLEIRQFPR